jgi:microcystin-dependent protein
MRFWADRPDLASWVQWFYVPPGTPFWESGGPFRLRDYYQPDDVDWNDTDSFPFPNPMGEQYGIQRFRTNGKRPSYAPPLGPKPCGSARAWRGEGLFALDPPLAVNAAGQQLCCQAPASATDCLVAPEAAATYWLYAPPDPNATYPCSLFGGWWKLTYQSNCIWRTDLQPVGLQYGWLLVAVPRDGSVKPAFVNPFIIGQPLSAQYEAAGPVDYSQCFSPTLIAPMTGCTGLPVNVFLCPENLIMLSVGDIVLDLGTGPVTGPYLAIDGSRVSQTTYASLFALWGFRFGPDLQDGNFPLPDPRDVIPYFAGRLYGTGATPGNDSPTLSANQLPAHSHPLNDPGHSHTVNAPHGQFFSNELSAAALQQNPAGSPFAYHPSTDSATTGASVGNNATAGNPLDVRQKGFAMRAKVFTGVFA